MHRERNTPLVFSLWCARMRAVAKNGGYNMTTLARVWHESDELRVGVAMIIGSAIVGFVFLGPTILAVLAHSL